MADDETRIEELETEFVGSTPRPHWAGPHKEPSRRRSAGFLVSCVVLAAALLQGCGGSAQTADEGGFPSESSEYTTTSAATLPETIPAKALGAPATTNDLETSTSAPSTSAPSTTAVPVTSTTSTTSTPSTTTIVPTTTQIPPIDAATAYLRRCGGCHGAEGTEQGALTLDGVGSLPESYVLEQVMTGGGGMPSFGDWLDQAEIDAIVAYVRASF